MSSTRRVVHSQHRASRGCTGSGDAKVPVTIRVLYGMHFSSSGVRTLNAVLSSDTVVRAHRIVALNRGAAPPRSCLQFHAFTNVADIGGSGTVWFPTQVDAM